MAVTDTKDARASGLDQYFLQRALADLVVCTSDDLQVYFQISRDTLEKWRADGMPFMGPPTSNSRKFYYSLPAVLAWFEKRGQWQGVNDNQASA